jgi:spermidine synthase
LTKLKNSRAPTETDASRYLPLLLILFAGSGCSALIYEIVWYQLLQLIIGSSAISLGVLLATFMGGLCIGSLALPRLRAARELHPLRLYALIELGIGICGLLVLFAMPLVDYVYVAAVGHGLPAILFRALICAICLLPPTVLMGASLPAISRWIQTTRRGVSWLGLLYGGNTVGAVFGCLLAGFYLLRVFNMATATCVAAAINGVVALASFFLVSRTPRQSAVPDDETSPVSPAKSAKPPVTASGGMPIYIAIALSGASALGAEVIWTRLLSLLLGATVYTFSIILAVFLVGLGVGSAAGSWLVRRVAAQAAMGYCQLLLAAGIAWTAFMLAKSIPFWPISPMLSTSPWYTFQIDLARVVWAILPPTLLWGASFPLALGAVASRDSDSAQVVGSVYAANTAGAIIGALAFSMILIPWIGTQQSERVLIVIAAASALVVLAPLAWSLRSIDGGISLAASMVLIGFLVWGVSAIPPDLIAWGRRIMTSSGSAHVLYTGEGMNSSIAISVWSDGATQFHVSGKVEASTEPYDMRLQRMLGHMPALLHPNPRTVLVVGFGAGVTAGAFVVHPEVQRIVICEMEKLIPPVATQYFGQENFNVMNDPRTQIVYDDARHFVLTTPEKFDIITSDPIHPWVKGSATLYSKEYFQLVKDHLNPGGIVTQWVPLYESDEDTVKSEIATFFAVFPNGTMWANTADGKGYDLFMLGQAEPMSINLDALDARLARPDYARVVQSLRQVGVNSVTDLLSIYAGQESDLRPWLAGAQINRDSNLRLQYLAGMALNYSEEESIYDEILRYRRFPSNLFVGSEERLQALRAALHAPPQ